MTTNEQKLNKVLLILEQQTNEQKLNQTLLILKSILPILEQQTEALQAMTLEMNIIRSKIAPSIGTRDQMKLDLPKIIRHLTKTTGLNDFQKATALSIVKSQKYTRSAQLFEDLGSAGNLGSSSFYKAMYCHLREHNIKRTKVRLSGFPNPISVYYDDLSERRHCNPPNM